MASLLHIEVDLRAELGRCSMALGELLRLGSGSVVALDRAAGSPVDLYANEELIARGELVAVDDRYGVRIVEVSAASGHPP